MTADTQDSEGAGWPATVPVLAHFAQVADPGEYAPLPDDWYIGLSDVVRSTAAIEAGQYKAVNLAGAGVISAVSNALDGDLPLFAFAGDGAHFAVAPEQAAAAEEALRRVSAWVRRDLGMDLRVGMVAVADVRAAGADVRAAYWHASDQVRYAMFTGGGLDWAEERLKQGEIGLTPADDEEEPDLTGLSCQWGPIQPRHGRIVSMIVKRAPGAAQDRFVDVTNQVVGLLDEHAATNPVPDTGPEVRWPSSGNALQSSIARKGRPVWWRRLRVLVSTALIWTVFKLGIRLGRFDPDRYRREIALNSDFRKFNDALMMTVDCAPETAEKLEKLLADFAREGIVRYGLHQQEEALVTCIVPSALTPDHMHFVDGAGGGYASAASQMRG